MIIRSEAAKQGVKVDRRRCSRSSTNLKTQAGSAAEVPEAADGLGRDRAGLPRHVPACSSSPRASTTSSRSRRRGHGCRDPAQYAKDKDTVYKVAAARKVAHILFGPKDGSTPAAKDLPKYKQQAEDVIKQLQQGADFTKLVDKYSVDPGKVQNQGVYDVTKTGFDPDFTKASYALKTGEFTDDAGEEPVRLPHHQGARRPDEGRRQVAPRGEGADQVAARGGAEEQSVAAWFANIQKQYQGKTSFATGYSLPPTTTAGSTGAARPPPASLARMIVALGPGGPDGIPLGALRVLREAGAADVRAPADVRAALAAHGVVHDPAAPVVAAPDAEAWELARAQPARATWPERAELEERAAAAALAALWRVTLRLRRDCPWDREQTIGSIVPHTIEEAYEVAEKALAGPADAGLIDELGDLLFQTYFLAMLAREQGAGDLARRGGRDPDEADPPPSARVRRRGARGRRRGARPVGADQARAGGARGHLPRRPGRAAGPAVRPQGAAPRGRRRVRLAAVGRRVARDRRGGGRARDGARGARRAGAGAGRRGGTRGRRRAVRGGQRAAAGGRRPGARGARRGARFRAPRGGSRRRSPTDAGRTSDCSGWTRRTATIGARRTSERDQA